ncbi:Cloroperoxidase [Epithele typhae]|uniref:Cloroperoxidase n=1 Tax=Epithele typhae TaxID=378194 RepID=UPI002007FCB0|nr:Cloroperoxidase [Epithele typhae]KAH9918201.1 Cloroperoxidase [Epithele typhae]
MPSLPESRQPYVAPSAQDSRSPCPALNSLANHGYLPHDGRNISLSQLVSAVQHVYGISLPFASILSLGGLVKCGHRSGFGLVLDLHDLAKHNVIEHDASLVHADTQPGETFAPTAVDPALLARLLATTSGDALSLEDLCRAQVARHAESPPLNSVQSFVSKGELSLIHDVFGVAPEPDAKAEGSSLTPIASTSKSANEELVVPKEWLAVFMGQDRLPEDWHGPFRTVGVHDTISHAKQIGALEAKLASHDAPV